MQTLGTVWHLQKHDRVKWSRGMGQRAGHQVAPLIQVGGGGSCCFMSVYEDEDTRTQIQISCCEFPHRTEEAVCLLAFCVNGQLTPDIP